MIRYLQSHRWVAGLGVGLSAFFAMGGAALATPTYDVTPVVTSVTSELTGNLPVILGIVGALIALSIAVRAVRKFVRV